MDNSTLKKDVCRQSVPLITAVLAIIASCAFGKYSGGMGAQDDPYQIATVEDLLTLAADTNDYNAHFLLTADIDLDPNLPGRKVFTTAVIAGKNFTGVFDGAGHKIENLTIDSKENGNDYLGLFESIVGGEVKNLCIEKVYIRGGCSSYYLGGLAGYNNKGSIINCLSTGVIAGGNDSDSIGGLVGDNNSGSIINCYSGCSVASGANSSNLGGLTGGNTGIIIKCCSTGNVIGGILSMWLGGLAGSNNGTIRNCYASGMVAGGEYSYNIGELVGDNPNGTIIDCKSSTKSKTITMDIHRLVANKRNKRPAETETFFDTRW